MNSDRGQWIDGKYVGGTTAAEGRYAAAVASKTSAYTLVDKDKIGPGEVSYDDYLDTKHWAAKRADTLRRRAYKCQTCSSTGQLNVHHNTYENVGHEKTNDLYVMCVPCHNLLHTASWAPKSPDTVYLEKRLVLK